MGRPTLNTIDVKESGALADNYNAKESLATLPATVINGLSNGAVMQVQSSLSSSQIVNDNPIIAKTFYNIYVGDDNLGGKIRLNKDGLSQNNPDNNSTSLTVEEGATLYILVWPEDGYEINTVHVVKCSDSQYDRNYTPTPNTDITLPFIVTINGVYSDGYVEATFKKLSNDTVVTTEVSNSIVKGVANEEPEPTHYIARWGDIRSNFKINSKTNPLSVDELVVVRPLPGSDNNKLYEIFWQCEKEVIKRSIHTYQDSPDIWVSKYSDSTSALDWCYSVHISSAYELSIYKSTIHTHILNKEYSVLGGEWCNGLRFKYTIQDPIKCSIIFMPNDVCKSASNIFDDTYSIPDSIMPGFGEIVFVDIADLHVMVVPESRYDTIVFSNFRKSIISNTNLKGNPKYQWICQLGIWMDSVIEPSIYTIPILGYSVADSPSKFSSEVEHYKVDQKISLFRYDGYIKPCFVRPSLNFMFTKDILNMSQFATSSYVKYSNTGYPKCFPSIGYYPWKQNTVEMLNTDFQRLAKVDETQMPYEYKYLGNNRCIILKPEITLVLLNVRVDITDGTKKYTYNDKEYSSIEGILKDELKRIYSRDDDSTDYIYRKYNWKSNWEYSDQSSIDTYDYTIKMTLK